MARFQFGQDFIDIFRGKKGPNCFVSSPCENPKGNALISYLKDAILLEDGDYILMEDGSRILLE